MKPFIIGIAGPSGSGKTTLANALLGRLPGTATLLSLDTYLRDLAQLPPAARRYQNFDGPDALDLTLLVEQLGSLTRGRAIESPVYEFDTHSRAPFTMTISPGDFVLVEGLFTLYWAEVRALLDCKVFVHARDEVCFRRLLEREIERGRTPASAAAHISQTVRPATEKFVRPTRAFADVVVSGEAQLAESVLEVSRLLRRSARASA